MQQDANGNVTALVNGSGTVVERYAYDPYGLVTYLNATFGTLSSSAYAANYLFQGERLDPATGYYHADDRDYSSTLQRWVRNRAKIIYHNRANPMKRITKTRKSEMSKNNSFSIVFSCFHHFVFSCFRLVYSAV